MESLPEKIDRIVGDVDKLIELYDFAEKVYPYSRIRDEYSVSTIFLTIQYLTTTYYS